MSDFLRDNLTLPDDKIDNSGAAPVLSNPTRKWSANDGARVLQALRSIQTYLRANILDIVNTVQMKDLDLLITTDPAVGPELDWGGNRGRWFLGVDVANAPTSRDFVHLGQRGTYSFSDGSTTNASPTLTSASGGNFVAALIGATISGAGIPNGTTITAVGGLTSLTMSANATATAGSVTVTITRSSVQDLMYWKHRGALSATCGIGVTPPDGSARLQVSPQDNEPAMGTVRLRRGPTQTGNVLTLHDSGPADMWWIDKDFYMSGAHSLGGAVVLQADVANARPLIMVDNAKGSAYGFLYPGGNALRFRYLTGGADVYQVASDGSLFIYQALTCQLDVTMQSGLNVAKQIKFSGEIAPPQITANQNDYSPTNMSTSTVLILTSDAARDITGFATGAAGRMIYVYNNGAQNITLKNLTTSVAGNQIQGRGAADTVLTPKTGAHLYYSGTIVKWIVLGDTL